MMSRGYFTLFRRQKVIYIRIKPLLTMIAYSILCFKTRKIKNLCDFYSHRGFSSSNTFKQIVYSLENVILSSRAAPSLPVAMSTREIFTEIAKPSSN